MAQLRHEYEQFQAANTEVLVMAPNQPASIARYLNAYPTPFPILSDPGAEIAQMYGVETVHARFLVFVAAMFVVDQARRIRYVDYDVAIINPDDSKPLAVVTGIS